MPKASKADPNRVDISLVKKGEVVAITACGAGLVQQRVDEDGVYIHRAGTALYAPARRLWEELDKLMDLDSVGAARIKAKV